MDIQLYCCLHAQGLTLYANQNVPAKEYTRVIIEIQNKREKKKKRQEKNIGECGS